MAINVFLSPSFAMSAEPGSTPTDEILANGLSNPNAITVDETNVYWTEYGSGTVKKVPKSGGTIVTLVSGLYSPSDIAVENPPETQPEETTSEKPKQNPIQEAIEKIQKIINGILSWFKI